MSKFIRRTQKGHEGKFLDRMPEICAAGKPTVQGEDFAGNLRCYNLQDEVDALVHDAIIPESVELHLPRQKQRDLRHAGPYTEAGACVNPPQNTKFMTLVDDFKHSGYASYWKKPVGAGPDKTPLLPEGFDYTKRMGVKMKYELSPLVYSKLPDLGPKYSLGYQTDRKYCRPAFNPDFIYGKKCTDADYRGLKAKCCLTDDRVQTGNSLATPMCKVQADFREINEEQLSVPKTFTDYVCPPLKPRESIIGCLTTYTPNTGKEIIFKCLSALNKLRRHLSKHRDRNLFRHLYLNLKYLDKEVTDWLPKQDVYKLCTNFHIKIDPPMIEPLLAVWDVFNGSQIKYKTFVDIINHNEPMTTLPKYISDISKEGLYYSTTYREMIKHGQDVDHRHRAGVPSGRYFDKDYPVTPEGLCKAYRSLLVQETDMKASLYPSIMTLMGVTHRDMYAKRSPEVVRKTFEKADISLTDEQFKKIWENAKQYHSQGWVCFETFRRAFDNFNKSKPSL